MTPLKLNLLTPITEAINSCDRAIEAHSELYRLAHRDYMQKNSEMYNPRYCHDLLTAACEQADKELDEFLQKQTAELQKLVMNAMRKAETGLSVTYDSVEYFTRLSFSLQLIQAAGDTIDDDAAYDAIGEFKHDLKNMHRMYQVIDRQIDDRTRLVSFYDWNMEKINPEERQDFIDAFGTGGPGFRRTFGFMYHAEKVLGVLEEMVEITKKLYTHKMVNSNEKLQLNDESGTVLFIPMLSLSEQMKVAKLKKLAQQVEKMLYFMEVMGDFSDDE